MLKKRTICVNCAEKKERLVLRGTTGAARLISTATLGALLVIGLLQNSTSEQDAKAYDKIKDPYEVKM